MEVNQKDQDVLLVNENGGTKLNVVAGLGEDGKLKVVPPKNENEPNFMKLDKQGNVLDNFMANFVMQYKEPTHFGFFKVSADQVENSSIVMQEMLKDPNNPSNKSMLDSYRVLPEDIIQKEANQEQVSPHQENTKPEFKPLDESRIDWTQLERLGVTRETLEKNGSLEAMLNWKKSPELISITPKFDDITLRTEARLSFRETEDGRITVGIHAIRKEPELDRPLFNVRLSNEDKQNLLNTGNAGRLIKIEPIKGQPISAYVSVDKLTNELVACRADKIRIPAEIKGIKLDDNQKQKLSEGRAIYLENMISKNGKNFNATLQVNADKRGIEFRFDETQKQNHSNTQSKDFSIPKKIGGVELSEKQQSTLKNGDAIYIKGLKDKLGQEYNAYVRVNSTDQKLDFFKWNPDKSKSKDITPLQKEEVKQNKEEPKKSKGMKL
ncbi:MAG: hypothetical protein CVU12_09530 [Bacteroidetes bacterium HGW-Bacteroidetes-7]|jgi:hypothetical protein|nr:MAG: hypothetical protein CVU12_09530 [Bacteroidetes bacterium HGW-Bacteroidetes-7]